MFRQIFTILLLCTFGFSYAQEESNVEDKMNRFEQLFEDEIEIQESNLMTLRFFNAEDGEPIPNATCVIRDLGKFETDEEGKVRFPKVEKDQDLQVLFTCDGFINSVFKAKVEAGTIFFNRFSVSPVLDLGTMRVVLDWDEKPVDLDAHFVKENSYHISYRKTRVLQDGKGMLDRDDMDGYGPETITVKDISEDAVYEYFVHDYTNRQNVGSAQLATSKATVKVFADNRLMKVFEIPRLQSGVKWTVFRIENGRFNFINTIE